MADSDPGRRRTAMKRLRDRLFPWIAAGAGAYLLVLLALALFLQREKEPSALQVLSVAPAAAVRGEEIALRASGIGFTRQTRLSLSPDLGNEDAVLATIPTWSRLQGFAVDGPLVYLANGYRGVQVMDVSRPQKPVLLGSLRTPGIAWKIVLAGRLAYVADKGEGLQIIDIADPQRPRIVAGLATGGNAVDVAVKGNRAYVANSLLGLQLIDVADPGRPRLIGRVPVPGAVNALAVKGDHVFLADARGAVHIVAAVGRGKPPRILSSLTIPGGAFGISVAGNFAYATGRRGLHVIDIRDPRQPRLTATVLTSHIARGLTLREKRAYVATGGGLLVFDIAVPAKPQLIGRYLTPGAAYAAELDGAQQLAYVCTSTSGLVVVDISEPRLPQPGPGVDLPAGFSDLEQVGDRLFAVGQRGLYAVDLDHPERPTVIGSLGLDPPPQMIALAGDRAYLLVEKLSDQDSTDTGIHIVDMTDLRQPQPRGFLPIDHRSRPSALAAAGNLLFAGTHREILIFDVEDAARPRHIGSLATPGPVMTLLADGPFLYAGDSTAGLLVIDISEPRQPRLLGGAVLPWHLQAYSRPKRIAKAGSTVLMTDGRNGLLIYQVADAGRPRLVASIPVNDYAGDLAVAGSLAFVSSLNEGIVIVDVDEPERPRITGVLPVLDATGAIAVRQKRIFLLNQEGKISALPTPIAAREMKLHSGTELSAVFPAPPTPGTYSLRISDGLRTAVLPAAVTVQNQMTGAELSN